MWTKINKISAPVPNLPVAPPPQQNPEETLCFQGRIVMNGSSPSGIKRHVNIADLFRSLKFQVEKSTREGGVGLLFIHG